MKRMQSYMATGLGLVLGMLTIDGIAGTTTTTTTGSGGRSSTSTTHMDNGQIRSFPVRRGRGRWVQVGGKWTYIPGTPVFEKRKIGMEMKVSNVGVTEHGVTLDIELRKVEALDTIYTDGGKAIFLFKSRLHLINGQEYRVLGTNGGRAYLRNVKTRKIISAPLGKKKVDEKAKDAKESDKSDKSGKKKSDSQK